ncbi:helix-turn-helix domain-containing protein [Methylorubrum podarium]|jgi:AraC-like DNA-binding protein|uniref:helix-turn-helix domain-containing protein n=1 Tax=Methylorubrum podarium TaxID=200476 RepID=UPI001EE29E53|nr:helix-turn-helix domain-containing protein [Methylorubrum podarium]GJE68549.1 Transcriptional activator FeaR [Methylorubrum podarium]
MSPVFQATLPSGRLLSGPIAMDNYHLGELLVGEVRAPAQILERTPRMVAQQGLDHLLLQFYHSGTSRVEVAWGEADVGPNTCILFDLAQPATVVAEPVHATNLLLPRALVAESVPNVASLHGHAFDYATDRVSRLFFTCVRELVDCADMLDVHQLPHISQAVAMLGSACLRGRAAARPANEVQLSIAIRQYIERELGSPRLDAEMLAAQFGLSRATLYRQFISEGGVQRFIRERRLLRAMKMLTQPTATGRHRVSTVAYTTGFSDEKTFSRAFKRRFGFLPRETEVGAGVWGRTADTQPVLQSWLKELAA